MPARVTAEPVMRDGVAVDGGHASSVTKTGAAGAGQRDDPADHGNRGPVRPDADAGAPRPHLPHTWSAKWSAVVNADEGLRDLVLPLAVPTTMGDVVEQSEGMGRLRSFNRGMLNVNELAVFSWVRETLVAAMYPLSAMWMMRKGAKGQRRLRNRAYWPITHWQGWGQLVVGSTFLGAMVIWMLVAAGVLEGSLDVVRADLVFTAIIVGIRSISIGTKHALRRPAFTEALRIGVVPTNTRLDEQIIVGWMWAPPAIMRRHIELALHKNGIDPATPLVFSGTSVDDMRSLMRPALEAYADVVGDVQVPPEDHDTGSASSVGGGGGGTTPRGQIGVVSLREYMASSAAAGGGGVSAAPVTGSADDVVVPLCVYFLRVTIAHTIAAQKQLPPRERSRWYASTYKVTAVVLTAAITLTPLLARWATLGAGNIVGDNGLAVATAILCLIPRGGVTANFWAHFVFAALVDVWRRWQWLRVVGLLVAPFDRAPWRPRSGLEHLRLRLDSALNVINWLRLRHMCVAELGRSFLERNSTFFAIFGMILLAIAAWALNINVSDAASLVLGAGVDAGTSDSTSAKGAVMMSMVIVFAAVLMSVLCLLFYMGIQANDLAELHVAYLFLRKTALWHGAAVREGAAGALAANSPFATAFASVAPAGTSIRYLQDSLMGAGSGARGGGGGGGEGAAASETRVAGPASRGVGAAVFTQADDGHDVIVGITGALAAGANGAGDTKTVPGSDAAPSQSLRRRLPSADTRASGWAGKAQPRPTPAAAAAAALDAAAARQFVASPRISRRLHGAGCVRPDTATSPMPAAIAAGQALREAPSDLHALQQVYGDAASELQATDRLEPVQFMGFRVDRTLGSQVGAVLVGIVVLLARSAVLTAEQAFAASG